MVSIFADMSGLKPVLNALDNTKSPPVLYLNTVGDSVIITIEPWDNIRTDQTAFLFINGTQAYVQKIEPLDATGPEPRKGAAPIFNVPVATNFLAGEQYSVEIKITDTAGNSGLSQKLIFDVRTDSLADAIKIDITEGAAGYNSDNGYLMPANVAVIRGPAGMHLTAHANGAVRFQDVGGADHCNFYFDENGLSPLVLIKIDNIHVDAAFASAIQDEIIISHSKQSDLIASKPVVFGKYEAPTDPLVSKSIDSVSCNTVGIADGNTLCIVSIILNKSYIDETNDEIIYIKVDDEVSIELTTYNKSFVTSNAKPNLPTAKIVNYSSEFGLTTNSRGKITVGFFPSKNSSAYWSKDIDFKELS